jgi:hypothetical protein
MQNDDEAHETEVTYDDESVHDWPLNVKRPAPSPEPTQKLTEAHESRKRLPGPGVGAPQLSPCMMMVWSCESTATHEPTPGHETLVSGAPSTEPVQAPRCSVEEGRILAQPVDAKAEAARGTRHVQVACVETEHVGRA